MPTGRRRIGRPVGSEMPQSGNKATPTPCATRIRCVHLEQLFGPDGAVLEKAGDDLASPGIPVQADEGRSREVSVDAIIFEIGGAEQDQRLLPDRMPSHALGQGKVRPSGDHAVEIALLKLVIEMVRAARIHVQLDVRMVASHVLERWRQDADHGC